MPGDAEPPKVEVVEETSAWSRSKQPVVNLRGCGCSCAVLGCGCFIMIAALAICLAAGLLAIHSVFAFISNLLFGAA